LFKHISIDKQLIDVYYRFIEQTSSSLLYQETRKLFHSDLTNKLPNQFYYHLWKHLIAKTTDQKQTIDYFVDFLLIERKKSQLILLPNDDDKTVREKIELFHMKKKFLIKEKITEQGLELIQVFIKDTLAKIPDTTTLLNGQLWRALILLNSLSTKDLNVSLISQIHLDKLSSELLTNPAVSSSTLAITLLELISHGYSFSTSFWYSQLERAPQSELYLLCARIAFLLNKPTNEDINKFIDLLKRNLSSMKSTIRLLSLRILSSFVT
ncbi:hypothetical protein DMUE_6254, partial [Dictyocoela muelleri]